MDWQPTLQKEAVLMNPDYAFCQKPLAPTPTPYCGSLDLAALSGVVNLLKNQSMPTTVDLSHNCISWGSAGGLIGIYIAFIPNGDSLCGCHISFHGSRLSSIQLAPRGALS
jgi:hypothetical protein